MIYLKEKFKKFGADFTKLYKDESIVIYCVCKTYDNGYTERYVEMFRYVVKQPNNFVNDEFEAYPSSANWGFWAWTATTIGSAEKILNKHFQNVKKEDILELLKDKFSR